jgi:hypothetical protein
MDSGRKWDLILVGYQGKFCHFFRSWSRTSRASAQGSWGRLYGSVTEFAEESSFLDRNPLCNPQRAAYHFKFPKVDVETSFLCRTYAAHITQNNFCVNLTQIQRQLGQDRQSRPR